jgi:hypothetical protein
LLSLCCNVQIGGPASETKPRFQDNIIRIPPMPLARLNRWLRPALTLLALAGTLALTACGGGSGAINNPTTPTPTPIATLQTLPAGIIIAYSGVPTTVKITGGLGPYQALSNNPAVLPVPLNISGDTIVLVPNSVAVGSDVPVAITVTDQSGQTAIVNVTVRFAPLFETGLTVVPSSGNCGTNLCDGENASVTAVATGPGGSPLPGRQIRFDVIYGPFLIVTNNPGTPLFPTATVVTDAAGVATVQIQATPNATTQQAQIRATDVATGQQQVANFVIQRATSTNNLSVVPPTATITAPYNNACTSGFVIDYYIYGGTPPYTIASTFPNAVLLSTTSVQQSGGSFRATTNGACVNPLIFTIVDAAGKTTTASLINVPGTLAPPTGTPTPPTTAPLVLAPTGGYTRPATFCQGGNTLTFTANGGTPPYNAVIIPTGATPANPLPTLPNGNVITAANTAIDVAFPSAVVGSYVVSLTDSSTPSQSTSQPIVCN